jgi:parallel beta-helix repeat protein
MYFEVWLYDDEGLFWPIRPHTGGHGIDHCYGDFNGRLHRGIDIPCDQDTSVHAVEDGKIVHLADTDDYCTSVIVIEGAYTIEYAHVNAVDELKDDECIVAGQKIGSVIKCPHEDDLVTHLHFGIISMPNPNDTATWQGEENPLLVPLIPAPKYGSSPVINKDIRFRTNEPDSFIFSQDPYLNPNELKGKVDIVVNAYDNIDAEKNAGIYKIKYEIKDTSGNILEGQEKTLIEWNQQLPLGVICKKTKVDAIYESNCHYSPSLLLDLPSSDCHNMWYIVTNTKGSGKKEDINIAECWDTTRYPDGEYTVTITAWDARNSDAGKSEPTSIDVIVKNHHILPVPYFSQLGTDWCVMNSAAMVMQYRGERVHSWDFARILEKGPRQGIDLWDVCNNLGTCVNTLSESRLRIEQCCVETIKHSNFEDSIVRWIKDGKPIIFSFPYPDKHAVVVCGYSREEDGDYVFIHDPAGSMWDDTDDMFIRVSWEEFKGGYELVIRTVISPTGDSEPNPPVIALNIIRKQVSHKLQSPSGTVSESFLDLDKGIPYKTNQDLDLPGFDCPSSNCLRYLDDMTINGYQELNKDISGHFRYSAAERPQGNYQLVIKKEGEVIHREDLEFDHPWSEENRAFSDSLSIPLDRFEIGEVHLIMEAGGDKIGPIDFELRTISKPDLAITRLWFNENLGDPGDDVEIIFDVTNQGSDVANPCVDCLYIDGSKVVEFDSSGLAIGSELKLGETRTWYYLYKDVPGTPDPHKIKACADCQNSVTESDENNNCKSDTLDITPIPDFTPLDLCMVLDRSGSMKDSMGAETKIQGVKEAATGVVNVLLPRDRVSMVSFSDTATTDADLTSDFSAVKTKINQLSAGGDTSFGAGLELALDQFNKYGNPDHSPAILFMSDGEHNTAPAPDTFVTECKNKGIPIYTVGFAKTESEVDVTRLKRMSDETGGDYLFVSEIFDLQNIFLKLQHKASGWESIATYVGEVNEGETVTAGSFYVDPAIKDLRVTLNWPGSNLDLKLYDPFGTQLDFSAPNVIYSGDTKPEYVIIKDPQSGTWTAKVYGKRIGSSEEYYVLVTKYEPPEGTEFPVHNIDTGEDFATIQSAIDDMDTKDGHTITVDPRTYNEKVVIDKIINLTGVDRNNTIIDGMGGFKTLEILDAAGGCNVSNLCISNATEGIFANGLIIKADNCIVKDCIFTKNSGGIAVQHSMGTIIANNVIVNNLERGIYLETVSTGTIRNNMIKFNDNGIWGYRISNFSIFENNILDNVNYAIWTYDMAYSNIYLNNFINNTENGYSKDLTNIWNSPSKIAYSYNRGTYNNYLGNYWDDYSGTDANGDGIGDIHYNFIDSEKDAYPLMKPFENYILPTSAPP